MTIKKSILFLAITSMVWSFGLELFRPVRKYVAKRKYFKRFRRMLKDSSNLPEKDTATLCPSCRLPFDKGKKRKLVDTCGHQRCYTCIFTIDICPLCQPQGQPKNVVTRRPNSYHFLTHQTQIPTRPNTISIDSEVQLTEKSFPKRCHMISSVEVYPQMDVGRLENKINSSENIRKTKSTIRNNTTRVNTDTFNDKSPGSTLSSVSSEVGWPSTPYQNLRSREQSIMSLMSISSQSSTVPMDVLKCTDESKICNPRFSLAQYSNFSLDLSSETSADLPSDKATVVHLLTLKPLYFEVPQPETDTPFLGRQWLFKELEMSLCTNNEVSKGIVVTGGPGTGKTALILQLVDHSSFGRKWKETVSHTTQDIYWKIKDLANTSSDGDQMSISSRGSIPKSNEATFTDPIIYHLASNLVGYHFCQADYNSTCLIPDFVHSLAAQLCQAPQLVDYRDLLLKNPSYQSILNLHSCVVDPDTAFLKGILEPLKLLSKNHEKKSIPHFIVIDSIHETIEHTSRNTPNLASFLFKHIHEFPSWLKVIFTVRTSHQDLLKLMSLHSISLDLTLDNINIHQDLLNYIQYRISNSNSIQKNITVNKKEEEGCPIMKFAEYIATLSKGSILYVKLTLDLLHQGCLVIKSSSFSVLPVNLQQVYMLMFNLRFTTVSSFKRICPILNVCLASSYPLTVLEAYHSINARHKVNPFPWSEFLQQIELLSTLCILVYRQDGSLMIAHPSLREWLSTREENEEKKFLCDIRQGHTNLALRITRLETPLTPERTIEMIHHLLRADIFTTNDTSISDMHLNSLWLHHCLSDPTLALVHLRNVFSPDIKVFHLLLQIGANPNAMLTTVDQKPLLNTISELGFTDIALLLLKFGADCNTQLSIDGTTPLMSASKNGHYAIVCGLLDAGAKIDLKDKNGRTAFNHAGENGHVHIIKKLLESPPLIGNAAVYKDVIHQSFISAAGKGHIEVCRNLSSWTDINLDYYDPESGHTALTLSSKNGHIAMCKYLLQNGASVAVMGKTGIPPVMWAVQNKQNEVVHFFLSQTTSLAITDKNGRTLLMSAVAGNNLEIAQLLLKKGVSVQEKDSNGLTAFSYSVIENNIETAQYLLNHKADIESSDINGKTPLMLATKHADGSMVELLLKYEANIEHKDISGSTPLLSAIKEGNLIAVSKLLHKGAKLGPNVWCYAETQPNILLILLHKLLSDGVVLYKKEKILDAIHRFQYALKKFPVSEVQNQKKIKFQQLKFYLLLGLARCNIKTKNYEKAIQAINEALEIRPESFEALYVRARANNEAGYYTEALSDVTKAMHLSSSDPKSKKILQALRADILTSSKIVCPIECSDIESCVVTTNTRSKETNVDLSVRQLPKLYKPFDRNSFPNEDPVVSGKGLFCLTSKLAPTVH